VAVSVADDDTSQGLHFALLLQLLGMLTSDADINSSRFQSHAIHCGGKFEHGVGEGRRGF